MTETKSNDDQVHRYLKEVEAALAQVDHPRKDEVLEDLRAHLTEKISLVESEEDLAKVIDEMGSPQEYAETLAPATGARPLKWYKRRRVQASVCVVVLFLIGSFTIFPDRYAIAAYYRQVIGKNYVALPFFDLKNIKQLKPGMTAGQIRDILGYPWHRYQYDSEKNEIRWKYTALPSPKAPFYTECIVITDATSWTYLRSEVTRRTVGPRRRGSSARAPRYREVGTFQLHDPDGKTATFDNDHPKLHVISMLGGDSSAKEKIGMRHSIGIVTLWSPIGRTFPQKRFGSFKSDQKV